MMMTRARLAGAVCAALILLPLGCSAEGVPSRYVPGEHYSELAQPVDTETGDRVEVIEFFLYGCSHCNVFDPLVEAWSADLSEDVAFRRVPVTFSGLGPLFARTFYTAKELQVLNTLHAKIFAAIHDEKQDLTTKAAIRKLFVENGVSEEQFNNTFESKKVKQQVVQADRLMRAYRVQGVPAMAVTGRYLTTGRQAGGNEAMLSVTDYLISKAR